MSETNHLLHAARLGDSRARMTLRIQRADTATQGEALHGTEAHWTAVRRLKIVDGEG